MKILRIITLLFFVSVLSAAAQMPAKRTMSRKDNTEQAENAGGPTNLVNSTRVATPPVAQTASPAKTTTSTNQSKTTRTAGTARQSNSKKTTTTSTSGVSVREFPTAGAMPDDAAWRRDVYRTIDLTKESNACLYYPVVPTNGRQNLFVYLFRLVLRGNVHAYEYTLDANEHFDDAHLLKGKKIMDTHNIYYENVDGKIRVNDADLPSEDVKLYFVKESVYYDQHTATFRSKVTALCPVMVSGTNDFGEEEMQRIPLFWVKYEEAAPYLAKLSLMGSSINNASSISCDDYFTMNRYEGEIYKTTNLQDRIISQYAETEEAQQQERTRIENEMTEFQDHLWGHTRDSLKNVFGNTVLDEKSNVITYDEEGRLVDGLGRRIAFAVADSVSVASPDNLSKEGRMVPVLVNDRGFAVDENGEPLLNSEGKPIEITYQYPDPEGIDGPNVVGDTSKKETKSSEKKTPAKATSTRRGSTSSKASSSSRKSEKSSKSTKSSKTKTPKASKSSKSSKSSGGGMTVRRQRH